MRDDFAITTAHIDLIADTAVSAGALGARMTGGGFGGCVIALVPADRVAPVADAVRSALHAAGYEEPVISQTHAAAGASPRESRPGRGGRYARLRAKFDYGPPIFAQRRAQRHMVSSCCGSEPDCPRPNSLTASAN